MKILAVANVQEEQELHVLEQIKKQTVQVDDTLIRVDYCPAKGLDNRRARIANQQQGLQYEAKDLEADLIWQLEGDTDLEPDTLERLIADYKKLKGKDFGLISGIQVGRHGLYHLGAWRNFTKDSFESLDYKLKGIQEVEAVGFYCLLIPKKVWLRGWATWDGEPYGPDVNWCLNLRKQGFRIYVDMDIPTGHVTKGGIIHPSHISTCNVKFKKTDKKWSYKTSD